MKTLLLLVSAGSLGACTQTTTTSLSELSSTFGDTTIEVVAKGQVNIEMHVAGDGCPTLGDDVNATFNGAPMNIVRGGYDTDATGCYPIAFWISDFSPDRMAAFELSSASGSSEMVVQDASAKWQVSPTRLFTNELVDDVAGSRLVWQGVDRISTARLSPVTDVRIEGDSIYYKPGTAVRYVDAYAHPIPDLCSGPSRCTVDLEQIRSFDTGSTPL